MEQLPQEVLKNYVLPFVGEDQFLFVASVNRSFFAIYSSLFAKKQTKFHHLRSIEQVEFCYADLLVRSKAPHSPQECIREQRMRSVATVKRPYIVYPKCLCKELLKHCVKMGRLEWVQYLYHVECPWDSTACSTAAYHGQLKILQWLHAHGCPWDQKTCSSAASGGHLEILQWAFQKNCPWDNDTTGKAAGEGHLHVLQWAADNGCPVPFTSLTFAAAMGHLPVVQWLHSYGLPFDMDTLSWSLSSGHFDIAKWAYENGCRFLNADICKHAAARGQLDALQWARDIHCPWDEFTCYLAAAQGKEVALFWAQSIANIVSPNDVPRQQYLDVLQYAHENGCPWDEIACSIAAFTDDLLVLNYLHENGCPWDSDTCANAATMGNLKVLKYAHENGCPWDGETCANAALHGLRSDKLYYFEKPKNILHNSPDFFWSDTNPLVLDKKYVDCLRYALANGCPCDSRTCENAAMVNVELLQCAREIGCPWDSNVCYFAAFRGDLDVLKYAHENGCPWGPDTFIIAAEMGHLKILQYIYDNDGPWDYGVVSVQDHGGIENLVAAHESGSIHVECPSLDALPVFCKVRWGNLHTSDTLKVDVFVCEQRVVRCFYNPTLEWIVWHSTLEKKSCLT